jgi:hypothetical protein
MHEALQAKRVAETGRWLLADTVFQNWISGPESQLLSCVGIGTAFISVILIVLNSWCR